MIKSSFIPPGSYTREKFVSDLGSIFFLKEEDPTFVKLHIYDTFDWRLYNHSLSLYRFGDWLYLYHLEEGQIIWSDGAQEIPSFVQDMPAGTLREHLEPVAGIRAMLKPVSGRIDAYSYRVLNEDEKTTARVRFESFQGDGSEPGQLIVYIRLIPLRGYQSSYANLEKYFKERGFLEGSGGNLYYAFMETAGKKPGEYTTRLDIQLDREMRSDDALRVILRFLLEVMRKNEPGIKEDIDSEFLHDYRVSIRRARSALSQMKGVFPSDSTARFREEFDRFGELTNSLRDLDVYLLKEDQYRDVLPPDLKSDLDPFFAYLKGKRQSELRAVTCFLESDDYRTGIAAYKKFLDEKTANSQDAPIAGKLVYELAKESIYKRYERVLKKGGAAKRSLDEADLHRLRIDCKKLRYLIEFFASLFDPGDIARLLKQLRRLQDNLGDFNDVCVQVGYLMDISQELADGERTNTRTLLAIGCLIGSLEKSKGEYKDEFIKVYKKFSSPKNRILYGDLFQPVEEEYHSDNPGSIQQ